MKDCACRDSNREIRTGSSLLTMYLSKFKALRRILVDAQAIFEKATSVS